MAAVSRWKVHMDISPNMQFMIQQHTITVSSNQGNHRNYSNLNHKKLTVTFIFSKENTRKTKDRMEAG